MVEINVYTPIGSQSQVMIGGKSFTEAVFSADSVRRLFDTHKDEEEFKFNIHCDGGDVAEGFTIYDLIRGSGKTIYTQIDGGYTKYETYGFGNGLTLSEATSTLAMDDSVVYSITMASSDSAQEESLPKSVFSEDLAATELMIKGLTAA